MEKVRKWSFEEWSSNASQHSEKVHIAFSLYENAILSSPWLPSVYLEKISILQLLKEEALCFFLSPLLHWNQVICSSCMSSQKSQSLLQWGEPATPLLFQWLLPKGRKDAADWSDVGRCQWWRTLWGVSLTGNRDSPGWGGALAPHTELCLMLTQSCPVSFSARFIPSAQHTIPASVVVVLRRAPRNIFIVTGGVSNRQFPQ